MPHKRGFTLIELLVVIAIIGLLATIIMASLSTAKAKSRDARRIADIKTIQTALELYYNDNYFYPKNIYAPSCSSSVTPNCGLAPTYIAVVPTDPSYTVAASSCASNGNTSGCYTYKAYDTNGTCTPSAAPTMYHLGTVLEQAGSSVVINDADAYMSGSNLVTAAGNTNLVGCTNAGSSDFDGRSAVTGTSICNNTAGTSATETCYDWTN